MKPDTKRHEPGQPTKDVVNGTIYDIQRCCIHDGPGIRTTVFLKGCPLNCKWCHNPESKSKGKQLSYSPDLCISCGSCVEACPADAHSMKGGVHSFDPRKCIRNLSCAAECPSLALEIIGRFVNASEVIDEVKRDLPYYQTSGGGMTLSGGEPMMQAEFTKSLLEMARAANIHTCVETSGYSAAESFREIVSLADLFLWDIKDTDSERHEKNTGVVLDSIMKNLELVDDLGGATHLRCVIIPEINLFEEHIGRVASIYKSLHNCQGVTLLPYHPLGTSKYERLADLSAKEHFSEPTKEDINECYEFLRSHDVECIPV
ncbi:glycyl-radical enzyme activating protein [Candidatus Hydrogenedentota bacterium]